MEDVLIQVDKFYYPVDFVVFDTKLVAMGANYVPIILEDHSWPPPMQLLIAEMELCNLHSGT